MNRLDNLKKLQHPILACYFPGEDPNNLSNQAEIYAEEGVDVYEIGVPDANPFMDGKLVKDSMARALAAGVKQTEIAEKAKAIRATYSDKAIVMMGYFNISLEELAPNGNAAFDGILQVGTEAYDKPVLDKLGICGIEFITQDELEKSLTRAKESSGYIFLQASTGKTGLRDSFDMTNKDRIKILRNHGVDTPILLGIGISKSEHAKLAMECGADGVVIGSACLAKAAEGEASLRAFLKSVRSALDAAR